MHNKPHMEFVDRIAETARLEAALSEEKSTLVVMYGRRRLGKSTLIKRVLSEGDVYFLALLKGCCLKGMFIFSLTVLKGSIRDCCWLK